MRDIQNRIVREDVETLDSFLVFKKENIIKVLTSEGRDGVVRLWIVSDAGWIYTYQVSVVMNLGGTKM